MSKRVGLYGKKERPRIEHRLATLNARLAGVPQPPAVNPRTAA
jgi:hypothetical protein